MGKVDAKKLKPACMVITSFVKARVKQDNDLMASNEQLIFRNLANKSNPQQILQSAAKWADARRRKQSFDKLLGAVQKISELGTLDGSAALPRDVEQAVRIIAVSGMLLNKEEFINFRTGVLNACFTSSQLEDLANPAKLADPLRFSDFNFTERDLILAVKDVAISRRILSDFEQMFPKVPEPPSPAPAKPAAPVSKSAPPVPVPVARTQSECVKDPPYPLQAGRGQSEWLESQNPTTAPQATSPAVAPVASPIATETPAPGIQFPAYRSRCADLNLMNLPEFPRQIWPRIQQAVKAELVVDK